MNPDRRTNYQPWQVQAMLHQLRHQQDPSFRPGVSTRLCPTAALQEISNSTGGGASLITTGSPFGCLRRAQADRAQAGVAGASVGSRVPRPQKHLRELTTYAKVVTKYPLISKCFMYYFIVNRVPFLYHFLFIIGKNHYHHQ